ncbi:hypothetical protein IWW34DRAFT_824970 [Fusarium oxysporum f. sp. albedinis]|nr:hypothetical protein IWW34DRAFT_824970 [Fusarium oxysporum f. sp. albedinis]
MCEVPPPRLFTVELNWLPFNWWLVQDLCRAFASIKGCNKVDSTTRGSKSFPGATLHDTSQVGPSMSGSRPMISLCTSTSFTDPRYHRCPTAGWDTSFVGHPPLTPLGMSSPSHCNGAPQLVRTSTITANTGSNASYHHISLYSVKAVLKIEGKLESMAENWTSEEWANRRRIVLFRKTQKGSTVNATCQSVSVNERPTNSICISCIWWAEKGECYVTSVDTIHLLEQLIAAPNRFSVEEKNRIRRNLEGFHPQTVSKAKPDSEEFFKIIMGFPNPKPRNIQKDVKVFPWKILESAIQKIIGKYSSNGGYAPLPTRPGQNMALAHPDADAHTQYPFPQHHNSIPSCRLQLSPQSS